MDKNPGKQTWQRKVDNAKGIPSLLGETKWKQVVRKVGPAIHSLGIYYIHCRPTPHKATNQHAKWTLESFMAQEKS